MQNSFLKEIWILAMLNKSI